MWELGKQGILALSLILWLTAVAEAAIVYTDLKPDFRSEEQAGRYALDLDRDRKPDFGLWFSLPVQESSIVFTTYRKQSVVGEMRNNLVRPNWLDEGVLIGPESEPWQTGTAAAVPMRQGGGEGSGTATRFAGLRIERDGKMHFGWVRVTWDATAGFYTIADFAYEDEPYKPIAAGDRGNPPIEASRVEKVHLTVVDLSEDEYQIGYQFVPAPDERAVGEYRVMALEQELAARFDVKIARQIGPENYHKVVAGQNYYSGLFPESLKTISGQQLQKGIAYQIAVLSIPPGNEGMASLSPLSNLVKFEQQEDAVITEQVAQQNASAEVPAMPDWKEDSQPKKPAKKYPKLRKSDYRLYSAGSTIFFKSKLTEVDPESTITAYTTEGTRLAGQTFDTPEVELNLSRLPEGIYRIKVQVNGALITRDIFIR